MNGSVLSEKSIFKMLGLTLTYKSPLLKVPPGCSLYTMHPCMECLVASRKLQKRICWTVALPLAASLESLAHCQNLTSLSLFYRYYFSRFSCDWLCWFQILFLKGELLVILIDCMIFLSPFVDVRRMSLSTVSFLVQLDSELSVYGMLSFGLNDFKGNTQFVEKVTFETLMDF